MSLRKRVLEIAMTSGRAHIGPALSVVDIVDVLYGDVMNIDLVRKHSPNRDRFILSKGHGCLGLYVVLEKFGLISKSELESYCRYDSHLGGHPECGPIQAIEFSTGSLGHGLAFGTGLAKAALLKNEIWRVFVLMGDGEMNEGSIWESALHASKHDLSNLTVIVDFNNMQASGFLDNVLSMEPIREKWEAFGFEVFEVNGHDKKSLRQVLSEKSSSKPRCVVANTIKGKGIPLAENSPAWHHKAKISAEEIEELMHSIEPK